MRNSLILPLVIILLACSDSNNLAAPELQVEIRTLDKFDQESQVFIQGEEVTIELSVTNLTDSKKTLWSLTTQTFDLQLKTEMGEIVDFWALGPLFGQGSTAITLGGNETHIVTTSWAQTADLDGNLVAIGDYVLEGWFIGAPEEVATISISII